MKESIKEVLLMGLGAISLTGEKANELKKELLTVILVTLSIFKQMNMFHIITFQHHM